MANTYAGLSKLAKKYQPCLIIRIFFYDGEHYVRDAALCLSLLLLSGVDEQLDHSPTPPSPQSLGEVLLAVPLTWKLRCCPHYQAKSGPCQQQQQWQRQRQRQQLSRSHCSHADFTAGEESWRQSGREKQNKRRAAKRV